MAVQDPGGRRAAAVRSEPGEHRMHQALPVTAPARAARHVARIDFAVIRRDAAGLLRAAAAEPAHAGIVGIDDVAGAHGVPAVAEIADPAHGRTEGGVYGERVVVSVE